MLNSFQTVKRFNENLQIFIGKYAFKFSVIKFYTV